ncbi:OVARIAN TUMOR DOMAIN-containing deubiquitinating enzyme 7-like isoform X4 [Eucalyptus grandis]|uniref:OVARIAN TUMOR DOMAIN-containing deubiquitinating enzyme 7-like isoform X4 n=1 Tax=Eucalyptus grandis TaxID=71139 RepID=UPI00192EB364|nr:OVARIAN TUMOR DOMAIN-containing deubiquitinating enzyme 7-like isoform X4 [Eucalyptus grandis]XP_039167460.1 OVARIAN TUMOR DOMAIN-containing deubiquitinating enzyme 7-like isoform X4 [Eucalyptus grandis]
MVQKQHHKSNAKKQPHVKKQGKQADNTQFRAQLDALGLKIVQVTADGNCFFRAVADQLEGNEEEHGKYRSTVVQYILKNREMFEPFIEDDAPFEEYCKTMDNDGTWAGHMELQAASLVTRSNICIHRNMSPRWYIRNFDQPGARMIHLSYHDEEHYNSVRLKEDTGDGPARPITIKVDSNLSSSSRQAKAGSKKSKAGTGKVITDAGSIKLVMAGSGCENIEKVEQTLLQMYGDVDAAIEYLIAEKGIEDFSEEAVQSPCNADASHGDDASGNSEEQREEPVEEANKENPPSNSAKRTHDDGSAQQEDKKIPRNKNCPCGSKKKYKSCCGSGTEKVSAISNNRALESRKGRKEKKRGKRGSDTSALSSGSDGGPLDMGALCI